MIGPVTIVTFNLMNVCVLFAERSIPNESSEREVKDVGECLGFEGVGMCEAGTV